jgi:ring-1,2-phenylacetyl-CoA epoxidase subunit PaaC
MDFPFNISKEDFVVTSAVNESTNQPINRSTNQRINQSTDHLIPYTLHLADNSLILGHRNSEWAGHGPILEQDIAVSNIALDLIGQSRNLYQYAAQLINKSETNFLSSLSFGVPITIGRGEVTEDDLAFLREEREFKNCLLVEQPNGDWAQTILRQFFFSTYQYFFYNELVKSKDIQLAAIAEKSLKETTYHLRWSSEWVIRLGDGTEESNARINKAVDELWMFTGEMFEPAEYEISLLQAQTSVDLSAIKNLWLEKVKAIFEEATLEIPETKPNQSGGKTGIHSEHLGFILAEMQYLQRTYPNSTW